MKKVFYITETNKPHIKQAIDDAGVGQVATIQDATRSLDQNALLWPLLEAVSRQVVWYGKKLSPWDWKDIFSAAHKKANVIPGIDGGFVVCGQSTSKMGKKDFSELIEIIYAFGAEHGVNFGDSRPV